MKTAHAFELDLPVTATDHAIGPPQARVTIVEYGDFECPHCKQAAPALKLLVAKLGDKVRFVFRHFPLESVHPHAMQAAEAAECAGAQGRFWPMHDLLFESQAHLKLPQLRGYAERLELEPVQFLAGMIDHPYLQRIREHIASGTRSGVRATPTFYVNGEIFDVSFGIERLVETVESHLAR
jgi:protein-disulfide isomerase